jgi:hypothetical protein
VGGSTASWVRIPPSPLDQVVVQHTAARVISLLLGGFRGECDVHASASVCRGFRSHPFESATFAPHDVADVAEMVSPAEMGRVKRSRIERRPGRRRHPRRARTRSRRWSRGGGPRDNARGPRRARPGRGCRQHQRRGRCAAAARVSARPHRPNVHHAGSPKALNRAAERARRSRWGSAARSRRRSPPTRGPRSGTELGPSEEIVPRDRSERTRNSQAS